MTKLYKMLKEKQHLATTNISTFEIVAKNETLFRNIQIQVLQQ